MKRSRGRGRRQQNPVNRSYDSNGPEVRVRGTAAQVYEKYQALARDAMLTGDRVNAENLQQHAEHYFRIMQTLQPPQSENAGDADGKDETNNKASDAAEATALASEPLVLNRGDAGSDGEKSERASKSRRRGPLRRRRNDGELVDGNVAEAASNLEQGDAEAVAESVAEEPTKEANGAAAEADVLPAVND